VKIVILLLFAMLSSGCGNAITDSIAQTPQPQGAVIVPIQNPSFETVITPPGYPGSSCGINSPTTSGWQFGPDTGVFQPDSSNNPCKVALPPDGVTVAYAGIDGRFHQTLSTTPSDLQEFRPGYAKDGIYTLKFSVANFFNVYPGYYEAKISFGAQELCEASGWGTRDFRQVVLACPSPGYFVVDQQLPYGPAQGHENLVITFHVVGWTLMFDKVSLNFTPNEHGSL
jgi:hypothetical protein